MKRCWSNADCIELSKSLADSIGLLPLSMGMEEHVACVSHFAQSHQRSDVLMRQSNTSVAVAASLRIAIDAPQKIHWISW